MKTSNTECSSSCNCFYCRINHQVTDRIYQKIIRDANGKRVKSERNIVV